MLREYLTVDYPNYVMVWDSQVLAGSPPSAPIASDGPDEPGLRTFNRLIGSLGQAPCRLTASGVGPRSWAEGVVQDIHHFHELGHQVAGLVPAIGVFVDSRSYGGAAAWAHRQLHEVRSATSHLHNATTAVPPYGFNTWASQRETQLWQQARDMVASAKAYMVAPFWTAFCLAFGRTGWCALLILDWASPASAQPGGGGDEGPALPQWLRTSAQVATHLREQGIHGPAMLGLLSSAIASSEADDYAEFARPVLDILCLFDRH